MSSAGQGAGKTVVAVGAGNIGSHLLPHLGRMAEVGRVVVVDKDAYEEKNLASQAIAPREVGKTKAQVVARRLRSIAPGKEVVAIAQDVANVPLGRLRGDVVVACLDSRGARRVVNTVAWRLGMPYVDTGVRPDGLLARVSVYSPGRDSPCLECGWGGEDYASATRERPQPCGGTAGPGQTNAPSALGALAAALSVLECRKLLTGHHEAAAVGREVLIDALHHKHYVTAYARNPECRFDHATWRELRRIRRDPQDVTLGDVFGLWRGEARGGRPAALSVEGHGFVTRMQCVGCGRERSLLRLQGRLGRRDGRCSRCGKEMVAPGTGLAWSLEADRLPRGALERPLSRFGFLAHDVFTVSDGETSAHFEIGGEEV